jgi:hypothetical protein
MIESAAKKKWCPMARVIMTDETETITDSIEKHTTCGPFNRLGDSEDEADVWKWASTYCITFDCMMWREEKVKPQPGNVAVSKYGYCGLAGKP